MTVKSSVGFVSGCKLLAKPIAYIVIECLKHRGITVVGNGGVTIGHSCLCSLPICCGSTRLFACLDRWLDVFAKIEPISMSGLVCIGPNAVLDIVRSAAKVYQRTQIIFNAANSEAARLWKRLWCEKQNNAEEKFHCLQERKVTEHSWLYDFFFWVYFTAYTLCQFCLLVRVRLLFFVLFWDCFVWEQRVNLTRTRPLSPICCLIFFNVPFCCFCFCFCFFLVVRLLPDCGSWQSDSPTKPLSSGPRF